ncbi:hypothetical protein FOZ63_023941 [Perkinsus olseni]|uniref:Uncharacterized protein n=1 Tax=Perkinsus olseni TaxID=32597 RepID=A0A7J6RCV5_PEROL|nr:hypothetical protein FOZ63_023941 [Perkinsus olseni]
MGGRPTLSPLYSIRREGYMYGLDSMWDMRTIGRYDIDVENLRGWPDVLEGFWDIWSLRTLGDGSHVLTITGDLVLVISLYTQKLKGYIPLPPGNALSDVGCVSNGRFFMEGREDHKLFSARLPPFGKLPDQPPPARIRPIAGVEWEAVADLSSGVTGMDVIARDDGKFKLVCVGYDWDTGKKHYICYVDYEGNESVESFDELSMCKFVPSYDELVCVAGLAAFFSCPRVSLVDIWSMSMLSVLDGASNLEYGSMWGIRCFLTVTENGFVVVGFQKTAEENKFFVVAVSTLP